MMENLKTKSIISAVAVSLVLASCKAPMVTVVKDEVKVTCLRISISKKQKILVTIVVQLHGDSSLLILIW